MINNIACQAILFDLDGVLVDSRAIVERTWARWITKHGIHRPDIAEVAHGRRTIDTIRDVAPHLDAESEAAWLERVEMEDVDGLVVLPGAAQALAVPDSRRAVVTSGGHALATSRLAAAGLPTPSVLITAENVAVGKPAPDGYLLAAQRLGVEPSACVVVEDSPAGIAAGRSAGATTIAVTTTFPRGTLGHAHVVVESLASLRVDSDRESLRIMLTEAPSR